MIIHVGFSEVATAVLRLYGYFLGRENKFEQKQISSVTIHPTKQVIA